MLTMFACALAMLGQGGPADLARKVQDVLPTAAEERWTSIPWRLDLQEAKRDAVETGRPIFLWIMNGHPFGCT